MPTIADRRLANQRLVGDGFASAGDAVRGLLAVQAQDYPAAKWAIGQRVRGLADAQLDGLLATGALLRTHVMRPTWHFVLPEDIRWLQALTRQRVQAISAPYHRQLGIDAASLRKAEKGIGKALAQGPQTRTELGKALAAAGIAVDANRLGFIMMHAELECLVVSGPMKGKQHTYRQLDEVVPAAPSLHRDEALRRLVARFFAAHGPARDVDLAWWSGLTLGDVRKGIALAEDLVVAEKAGEAAFWSGQADQPQPRRRTRPVHLLPNYDEYFIAYRDRSDVFDPARIPSAVPEGFFFRHVLAVDGWIVGAWRQEIVKKQRRLAVTPLVPLSAGQRSAAIREARRFADFIGAAVQVTLTDP